MKNSFYQQIEDEEASRLAKNVANEENLKEIAEATRTQFYLGTSRREITLRSVVAISSVFIVVNILEDSFLLALVLIGMILELWRLQEKLDATTKLLFLRSQGELKSDK